MPTLRSMRVPACLVWEFNILFDWSAPKMKDSKWFDRHLHFHKVN